MDYLFKSSICMTVFYGLYFFGFRRLTFHALNRFYLLASLALSLTIPMLSYEHEEVVIVEPNPVSEITYTEENPIQSTDGQAFDIAQQIIEPQPIEIDWLQVLTIIYLSGMAMMLFIFLRNIIIILKSLTSASLSERFEQNGITIIMVTKQSENLVTERSRSLVTERSRSPHSNASFFNYLFLNPDNLNPHEQALIIAHESFHAKQFHTLDLLLISFLKAVFWFNPIIYFYQKSLKQIHEYEVDTLMSATHDSRAYAHLLLKLGIAPNSLTINQFSTKPLSDRIQFLFKTPTKNMKKLLYFLSIPIIAVGVMAFAQEKVRVIYQEKEGGEVSQKSIPAQSPLKVFYKNIYGMNLPSLSVFSERNLTVNDLFLLPAAIYYDVNPNFLTPETIEETNSKLKSEGYKIIVNDKENDLQNNFTKLNLSIKNLKTNQTTQVREIDMVHAREVGKQGAWIFFAIYKNHFQDSDVILTEGSSDLAVNIGEKVATTIINKTSNLRIAKKDIIYKVSPDRLNIKTFEKVKAYFAKEGFVLSTKNEVFDKNNHLLSLTIQIDNGKEKTEKQVILNNLRHLIRLKTESKDKARRWDETLVIEANKDNKEVKISYDDRWFQGIKKSDKHEIMEVVANEIHNQIDSTKFNYYLSIKTSMQGIDRFTVIVNNQLLLAGKDYILKGNGIYLDEKYKGSKISSHVYSTVIGTLLYPQLAQLSDVHLPKLKFSSKMPIFVASNENKFLPQIIKSPSSFSIIAKSRDTIRTILETNKLGENPLVIINGEEYPSSILTRIDPTKFGWSHLAKPNDPKYIGKYGEKARDGFIEIRTIDDFLFKDEKTHQIAIENVRKQLEPSTKRVRRLILKDADGKDVEQISLISHKKDYPHATVTFPVGSTVLFILDGEIISEEGLANSKQDFLSVSASSKMDKKIIEKFGEELKKYDTYFIIKTKRD